MEVKVTSKIVEGLTDGFTGRPLEVVMSVSPGVPPMFHCPGAYSVHVPYDTLAHLQEAVSMKNGVRGIRDVVNPVDPYTGEAFTLRTFPDGRFSYAGGLNPRRAFQSLAELVRALSMRDGKTSVPEPGAEPVATRPRREARQLPDQAITASDATKEVVEKAIVDAGAPRPTVVSMAGKSNANKPKGSKKK